MKTTLVTPEGFNARLTARLEDEINRSVSTLAGKPVDKNSIEEAARLADEAIQRVYSHIRVECDPEENMADVLDRIARGEMVMRIVLDPREE